MAVSTRTITNIPPPVTQASLTAGMIQAFSNAGFDAPIQSTTSGTDQIIIWAVTLDGTKTYGTTYLKVRITNALAVFQQLLSSWNTTTKTGNDGSTEVSYITLSPSVAVVFNSFSGGAEVKQICVTQNALFAVLGAIFPENRRTGWDLGSYPYGFVWSSVSCNVLRATSRVAYASADFDTFMNNSRMGTASPYNDGNDLLRGITLLSQSNNGIGSATSQNLGFACASGLPRFASVPITGTNQIWIIINNVAGGYSLQIQ